MGIWDGIAVKIGMALGDLFIFLGIIAIGLGLFGTWVLGARFYLWCKKLWG
jgi:hypothetical protein